MIEDKGVDSSVPLRVIPPAPPPPPGVAGGGGLKCAVALLALVYAAGKRLASLAAVGGQP